ncbi:MAG: hypothetical protein JSR64_09820 [Nitrospira sp.]|nr:hypothetical protein [Nitrospira sp.]MBS0194352.1 Replication initiator protein A [Pseudomonadota bacterium]
MGNTPSRFDVQQLALPFWPEHLRGVPTAALYSALFAPIRKGARQAVQREKIASISGYKIIYTGFRLDQADLDVFEHVLHMFRRGTGDSLGHAVKFSTREMLKAIGRDAGKSQREWLLRSLSRLQACAVEIQKDHLAYSGALIQEIARNDDDGTQVLILNPRLMALFDAGYSQISWKQRQALSKRPLAQWLHGFVSNQQRPLSFKLEDLAKYADSGYARERDFRNALDAAAADIRSVGIDLVILWSKDFKTATFTRTSWKGATAVPPPGA